MNSNDIKKIIKIIMDSNSNNKEEFTQKLASLISANNYDEIINRNNYVASILWTEGDLKTALSNNGIKVTDENIEELISNMGNFEDREIECGYSILDTIISNCHFKK